jgi:hypothetical protein
MNTDAAVYSFRRFSGVVHRTRNVQYCITDITNYSYCFRRPFRFPAVALFSSIQLIVLDYSHYFRRSWMLTFLLSSTICQPMTAREHRIRDSCKRRTCPESASAPRLCEALTLRPCFTVYSNLHSGPFCTPIRHRTTAHAMTLRYLARSGPVGRPQGYDQWMTGPHSER